MSTAHHSRTFLFLVGSSALATVDGCAAAQAEETGSTESAQRTSPRAAEELGSGGATARLIDDTLYLKADQQTVHS